MSMQLVSRGFNLQQIAKRIARQTVRLESRIKVHEQETQEWTEREKDMRRGIEIIHETQVRVYT